MFINKPSENSTRLDLAFMILVQVSVLSVIQSTGWTSDSSESVSVSKSTVENNPMGVQDRAAERFEVSWWVQSLFGGLISGLVILLGFCLKEYADRKKAKSKDKEFLASVCAELRHILPSLVLTYCKTKANLDGLTGQEFKWFIQAFKEFHLDKVTDPAQQGTPIPEANINELSDEDLNRNACEMTRRSKKPDESFLRFSPLELCFLEHNLPMIGRLPVKTQEFLFWIVGRIKNINDLFEQLDSEFERSFICSSNNVKRIIVNENLYYDKIATISYLTANEIMEFLRQNWICSNSGNPISLT